MHNMNNTRTSSEWNIVKGLGALGLPFVHTVEIFILCELVGTQNSLFCNTIMSLTVFGPSIFMICMGMSNAKTMEPKALFRYGRILLSIGLLLNLLRSILPAILVATVAGSTADHLISFIFMSDIYLFAGLFYILLCIFRHLNISMTGIVIISLIMLAVNDLFGGCLKAESETLNAIMGNLIYIDDGSVFPLLSWTIFPVFGMLIDIILSKKSSTEANKLCQRVWLIAVAVFGATITGLQLSGLNAFQIAVSPLNEYKTGFLNVLLVLCINLIVIIPLRFLIGDIQTEKITAFLNWLSANLMVFYFVNWCILTLVCYIIAAVLFTTQQNASIGLMLSIAVLTDVLTVFIIRKWGFAIMKKIMKVVRV